MTDQGARVCLFSFLNCLRFNIKHLHVCLLTLQCSEQVTVMGGRTASEVLYQRIIPTPDLL